METADNQGKARIQGLDTLRGLAIILVMFGHFIPEIFKDFYTSIISPWGDAGVLLFFYLSGFLIFRNVQSQPPGIFLLRRFFKLMPAYWINIAVIILISILILNVAPDAKTIFSNLLMVQEFTNSPLLNNAYWTLQIEVKFYIVMVVFHSLFGAKRIYGLLGALILVNIGAFLIMHRGSTLITYLIAFFPGIAAARGLAHGWTKAAFREMAIVTIVAAIFLADQSLWHAGYALALSALLTLTLNRDFSSKFFAFFGKISYSHYLYHTAIGYPLIAWMLTVNSSMSFQFITLGTAIVITVAVATASFYLIEKPAINSGHRLEGFFKK
jgi:peptidoglycan/LPS O-acetylase OafA/YrhL